MTQREKTLATTLVVLMGFLGSGAVLFLFVLEPLKESRERVTRARAALDEKQQELEIEQAQVAAMLTVNPRLGLWNEISLSPRDPALKKASLTDEQKKKHLTQLQVKYDEYLSDLLARNGFQSDSISIRPRQVEQRATMRGKKQPVYERLAFSVVGRATLDDVVKTLGEFHRTPLLHQVRNLSMEPVQQQRGPAAAPAPVGRGARGARGGARGGAAAPSTGLLELKMTVEALAVNGARVRPTLLPTRLPYPPRVLAEPGRSYALMTKKNMFTGIPLARSTDSDRKLTEEKREVLRFIKLTALWKEEDSTRWTATLYDQAKGGAEIKLGKAPSWRAKFKILDKYEETVLEGRVVHVDEKQVIFCSEDKYYRLNCGDFLYPAVDRPLAKKDLEELGIETTVSAAGGDSSQ